MKHLQRAYTSYNSNNISLQGNRSGCHPGERNYKIGNIGKKIPENAPNQSLNQAEERRPCGAIFHVTPTETSKAALMSGRVLDAFQGSQDSRWSMRFRRIKEDMPTLSWDSTLVHPSLPRPPHKRGSRSFYEELVCCPHVCMGFGKHALMFSLNRHFHEAHFPLHGFILQNSRELRTRHACAGPALHSVYLQLKSTSLCRPSGRLIQGSARLLYSLVLMSGPLSELPTYTQFAMTTWGQPCSSGCPALSQSLTD